MATTKGKSSRKAKNENPQLQSSQGMNVGKVEESKNKAGDAQIQEPNAQEGKEKMPSTWTRNEKIRTVINGLTGLGIIATVIVVYFMTSEQNRISEQSLYATKKGMELADSSYVVQNRAYVLPQLPSVATMPDGTPAVSIPFVNYGKTPAYRFCMQIRYQLWDTIREDPKSYTYSWSKYEKTLAPQYPDTEYIPRDSVYWKVPGGKIFTYGKIWYIDFVGKQHFTTFAYFREFRRGKKFAIYPGYDSTEEY